MTAAPLGQHVTLEVGAASVAVAGLTLQAFSGLVGPIAGADRDPGAERAGIALAFVIASVGGYLSWAMTDSLLPGVIGLTLAASLSAAYGARSAPDDTASVTPGGTA